MISSILNQLASGSAGITTGSAGVDAGSDFFAGVLRQVSGFFSASFGS